MGSPKKSKRSRGESGRRKTLDRALSRLGVCSRAEAERWVREGRVTLNGVRAKRADVWVDLQRDRLTVDGREVREPTRIVLALHKPVGFVTTRSDPEGRKTVYELIGEHGDWIAPIGRLDRETSGLLLFTNDPVLASRITDPATKLAKTYRVKARGVLTDEMLERLRRGVQLDDGMTLPAELRFDHRSRERTYFDLTIVEGRNRQIRRMLQAVGSKVLDLERIAIGPIELGELAVGEWRELASSEIAALNGAR